MYGGIQMNREVYRCVGEFKDVWDIQKYRGMYRGIQMYGGIQMNRGEYRCIGHTDIWEMYRGIQIHGGCKDVQGAYTCMGDVQMYGGCTDIGSIWTYCYVWQCCIVLRVV